MHDEFKTTTVLVVVAGCLVQLCSCRGYVISSSFSLTHAFIYIYITKIKLYGVYGDTVFCLLCVWHGQRSLSLPWGAPKFECGGRWPTLVVVLPDRHEFCADEPSSRLLLAVQKPTVTNTTDQTITIEFKTGPNLQKSLFEVKCTNGTFADCSAPALGVPVNGTLPKKYSKVSSVISGLEPSTTYNCFVLNTWKKTTKCMGVKGNATTLWLLTIKTHCNQWLL